MSVLYRRPRTLDEALRELGDEDALVLAGGQSLVLLMNLGLLAPAKLVSIDRLPGLRTIQVRDDRLEIGALCTHASIAADPTLHQWVPAARQVFSAVGNARVRASGTLGGNLVHADPAQDPPVLLSVLGAVATVVGPRGEREIPVDGLAVGLMTTTLADDEILTRVSFLVGDTPRAVAYEKLLPGSKDDYSTVSIAAALEFADDGRVRRATLAAGSVAPTVLALDTAASSLEGQWLIPATLEALRASVAGSVSPTSDQRGSADYKREMAGVAAVRAVMDCAAEAGVEVGS